MNPKTVGVSVIILANYCSVALYRWFTRNCTFSTFWLTAFAQKGVPGIYFETEGSILQYYHTPRDSYENTRDSNFDRLFYLVTKFVE